jgi:hypothetical protein
MITSLVLIYKAIKFHQTDQYLSQTSQQITLHYTLSYKHSHARRESKDKNLNNACLLSPHHSIQKAHCSLTKMCFYGGIFYLSCGHTDFELQRYCPMLRYELDRINDPWEREQSVIPFDLPNCDPKPRENVVYWTINKSTYCGRCYCGVDGSDGSIGIGAAGDAIAMISDPPLCH